MALREDEAVTIGVVRVLCIEDVRRRGRRRCRRSESAEPMWPTPARMDCSRTMRRIPCANAWRSFGSASVSMASNVGGCPSDRVICASRPRVPRSRTGHGRALGGRSVPRAPHTTARRIVTETSPVANRVEMCERRWGLPHEHGLGEHDGPHSRLSAAATTFLSAGRSTSPSWLPLTIGNAFPSPAASSTAVRRLELHQDDRSLSRPARAPEQRFALGDSGIAVSARRGPVVARPPRHGRPECLGERRRSIQPPIACELEASSHGAHARRRRTRRPTIGAPDRSEIRPADHPPTA